MRMALDSHKFANCVFAFIGIRYFGSTSMVFPAGKVTIAFRLPLFDPTKAPRLRVFPGSEIIFTRIGRTPYSSETACATWDFLAFRETRNTYWFMPSRRPAFSVTCAETKISCAMPPPDGAFRNSFFYLIQTSREN